MNKFFFILTAFICSGLISLAQTADPVIMTIETDSITKSEFEKVYRKNNVKDGAYDMDDLKEYVELYINYKLKVKEAESLKLDTNPAFISELRGYRKQLAQPYMTDKEVTDALVKEAYDRLQKDVRASHILISCADDALPIDTLAAYNRASKIRQSILNGADFAKMARDSSADPSAKENGGDLGFFTALQMVYPFECAAYNTKRGDISMPVRTRFGYHIIKVHETRPAKGTIKVAHIMVKLAPDAPDSVSIASRTKIYEIYDKIKAGESFEEYAAKYSDDKASGRNGGELPPFGTGRMVPEFERVSFSLQNDGDFSEPVRTTYGWHIIKRLELIPVPTFEVKQNELKNQVSRDSRANLSRDSKIAQIKSDYKFKEYKKNLDLFCNKLDSTLTEGTWDGEQVKGMNKPLFSLADKTYTQEDFAKYINSHQSKRTNNTPKQVAYLLYAQFVDESCYSFEEDNLENKYPEFASLMQEYRDGILLFDLTDKKVWSKAVQDTVGLKEYYENNKNNYMWGQRVDAVVYSCKTPEIATKVRKYIKKKKTTSEILQLVNADSQLNLSVKAGKFQKGDNEIIDMIPWMNGVSENIVKDEVTSFVDIKEVIDPTPKELNEAKGVITADYQNYLEKQWIAELRAKYKVEVNKDVVSSFGSK